MVSLLVIILFFKSLGEMEFDLIQGGLGQGGHGQGGHGQGRHGQGGHGQGGHGQGGHGQEGHGQEGHGQEGHGQEGFSQVGQVCDIQLCVELPAPQARQNRLRNPQTHLSHRQRGRICSGYHKLKLVCTQES